MKGLLGSGWLVALWIAALLVAGACGDGDDDDTALAPTPTVPAETATFPPLPTDQVGLPIVEITTEWASQNATTLDALLASSPVVFVGTVTELLGQRLEAAGRREDATLPVSMFELAVENVIAGTVGSSTVVEQIGGVITQDDGTEVRIKLRADEPLELGQRYLIFANERENDALSSPPFARFTVGPDGVLTPLPDWEELGVPALLSGLTIEEAEDAIREAGS